MRLIDFDKLLDELEEVRAKYKDESDKSDDIRISTDRLTRAVGIGVAIHCVFNAEVIQQGK